MKIAFFSPLNPQQSGISDYSENLLRHLAGQVDIDLFLPAGFKPANPYIRNSFRSFPYAEYGSRRETYDCTLYHIGNNASFHSDIYQMAVRFPGIVVLHDVSIHEMMAVMTLGKGQMEKYVKLVEKCHGLAALEKAKDAVSGKGPAIGESPLEYPMNKILLDRAKAVIVHSSFAAGYISKSIPHKVVKVIPHYSRVSHVIPEENIFLRQSLGVDPDAVVIASFGDIVPAKRIESVLEALSMISSRSFIYFLVGSITTGYREKITRLIHSFGLEERVIFTGHVDLDKFKKYMKISDICLNLRYPYGGESSGSMLRLLGMGKPVIVSDIGSFSDFPDDIVIKVDFKHGLEVPELVGCLNALMREPALGKMLGENAKSYIEKNCLIEQSAAAYINLMEEVSRGIGCSEANPLARNDDLISSRLIWFRREASYLLGSSLLVEEETGRITAAYRDCGLVGDEETHSSRLAQWGTGFGRELAVFKTVRYLKTHGFVKTVNKILSRM